jgi:predicted HAD superfamily Cof-like phosphohydrolase
MREELNEFRDAFTNEDLIEMADALCDLSYVTNGAGQCLGMNLDNLIIDMKVQIHTPNNFNSHVGNFCDKNNEMIKVGLNDMESYLNKFYESTKTENLKVMSECLVYILDSTYKLGHKLNFNMDKMFTEVHRSNMTKVCSNIEDAKESVEQYEKEGRYAEPSIRIKGPYYVIYDKTTSKILKNHKWETPNLKQFM